jgi:hypothetical protein
MNLQWASAEVKDGTLTVGLEGEPPDGWNESFERTVTLLGRGEWGEVALEDGTVQVSDVTPGSEEKLRHHIEAIVLQANAAHDEDADEGEEADGAEKRDGPDAEMTDRFRAFGEDDDDADADADERD